MKTVPPWAWVAVLAVGAAGAAMLFALNPETSRLFPPCPSRWLTGWHCPGCGTLRALHQLLNGNLMAAISFNPLAVLSMPLLAWMAFRPRWVMHPHAPWAVLAVVVVYGVLRNIPAWPWHLLAPGGGP